MAHIVTTAELHIPANFCKNPLDISAVKSTDADILDFQDRYYSIG